MSAQPKIRFIPMGSSASIFSQWADEEHRLDQLEALHKAKPGRKPGRPLGQRAPVIAIQRWAAERVIKERDRRYAQRNARKLHNGELAELITEKVEAAKLKFPRDARKVDFDAVNYLVTHPQRLEQ